MLSRVKCNTNPKNAPLLCVSHSSLWLRGLVTKADTFNKLTALRALFGVVEDVMNVALTDFKGKVVQRMGDEPEVILTI